MVVAVTERTVIHPNRNRFLRRRDLLTTAFALPFIARPLASVLVTDARAQEKGVAFEAAAVRATARDLAQKPYKAPDNKLPDALKDLSYDRYRMIRFKPDQAMWRAEGLPFQLQFFHRGFYYTNRVDLYEVKDGIATPIVYSPDMFTFGDQPVPEIKGNLGFAGFRIHGPINRPDYFDEIGVFLGASYFRAVAKGQIYGLSARGLSIKTADPTGEEFPIFKSFWIERPAKGANSIVVHALLDSESAAAAYRFTIRPGETTTFDIEVALYPRVQIEQPGLATLTSMYFFGPNDRGGVDDFRPSVHDSDGLAIQNGRGEQLWRPLSNPADLQVSAFVDNSPRGFGLMQRERAFRHFEDLEARYEKRPSAWVEPIGDWGEGEVRLVEIPTSTEINDNIVSFWRPRNPTRAKGEYTYTYRVHWGARLPKPQPVAQAVATRIGAGTGETRQIVIDFAGENLKAVPPADIKANVSVDKGTLRNIVVHQNPEITGTRVSFQLAAGSEKAIELRAQLTRGDDPLSEVWVYRWTP
jgi:periplasmic glucans biosynthesis protein